MILILGRDRIVWDGSKWPSRKATITAGEHEVETVPNPYSGQKGEWIVKKGTMIGAPIFWWELLAEQLTPFDETKKVLIRK